MFVCMYVYMPVWVYVLKECNATDIKLFQRKNASYVAASDRRLIYVHHRIEAKA